jgi:hypothetical protein
MPVSRLVIAFFTMFGTSTVGLFRKFVLFGGSLVRIVHGLSPVEANVNSQLICTRRAKHFCMRRSLSGTACLFQWRQRRLEPQTHQLSKEKDEPECCRSSDPYLPRATPISIHCGQSPPQARSSTHSSDCLAMSSVPVPCDLRSSGLPPSGLDAGFSALRTQLNSPGSSSDFLRCA